MWPDDWPQSAERRVPLLPEALLGNRKGSAKLHFRMSTHLGRRARKNCLDDWQIQQSIVTTASDETQSRVQNRPQHGGIAVQTIQTDHDLGAEKLVRPCIAGDHLESAFEFSPVVPIARSPKGAQELMGMCLQNRGTGSHDFPSLASFVTRSRNLGETPMGCGKRV